MVQSCLLLRGDQENQSEGTPLSSGGGARLLIRCCHYRKLTLCELENQQYQQFPQL